VYPLLTGVMRLVHRLAVALQLQIAVCADVALDPDSEDWLNLLQRRIGAGAHGNQSALQKDEKSREDLACEFSVKNCSGGTPHVDDWPAASDVEAQLFAAVPDDWRCLDEASLQAVLADQLKAPKTSGAAIPKVLHQSWKTHDVPEQYGNRSRDSFKISNPGWSYRLWNDEENRELLEFDRADLLDVYDAFEKPIYRADMVRPLYLWRHGGVYADLDYTFYRALEPALKGHGVVLAAMQTPRSSGKYCRVNQHSLPNAFMAGAPGHPFWRVYMELIRQSVKQGCDTNTGENCCQLPEQLTGPVMLLRALKCYRKVEHLFPDAASVHVAEPRAFCPCSWGPVNDTDVRLAHERGDEFWKSCKMGMDNRTFAATWWGHTWAEERKPETLGTRLAHFADKVHAFFGLSS